MDRNLLFIGNGFDLYHGLPTRYTDFLEFAKKWNVFYEIYRKHKDDATTSPAQFEVRLDEGGKLCENTLLDFALHATAFNPDNIEYLNEHLSNNAWLNFFIASDYKKEGWIDFEKLMKDAIIAIDTYLPLGITHERLEIRTMREIDRLVILKLIMTSGCRLFTLSESQATFHTSIGAEDKIEKEKQRILNYLRIAMDNLCECLRLYLCEFVQRIVICKKSSQLASLDNLYLLSVNYTNTFERIYDSTCLMEKHFVHGNVDDIPNSIVLGFDSSGLEKLDYVYFYKYFQRIQKRTGNLYRFWLSDEPYHHGLINVHIFGHSLDTTDQDILIDLIKHQSVQKIYIYYHSQNSYESQVINLIRLLGRDYVIEKVGNGRIRFVEIK